VSETHAATGLRGKILLLGCAPVHGIDLGGLVTGFCPDAVVHEAADLRETPRSTSWELVLFPLPTSRTQRTLGDLRRRFPSARLVAVVPAASPATLAVLLRAGCDDFLVACDEPELSGQLSELFERIGAEQERAIAAPTGTYRDFRELGLIGRSRAVRGVFDLIRKAADSNVTVLITGESGTGKELVARAIHRLSDRRSHSFVAVNCGAIPLPLATSAARSRAPSRTSSASWSRPPAAPSSSTRSATSPWTCRSR
jgi:DNA-binding NtrC family response regulator